MTESGTAALRAEIEGLRRGIVELEEAIERLKYDREYWRREAEELHVLVSELHARFGEWGGENG